MFGAHFQDLTKPIKDNRVWGDWAVYFVNLCDCNVAYDGLCVTFSPDRVRLICYAEMQPSFLSRDLEGSEEKVDSTSCFGESLPERWHVLWAASPKSSVFLEVRRARPSSTVFRSISQVAVRMFA